MGAANEAMREGDGEEGDEEEEEEAEEELSGSSRCANLGPRDVSKQVKGYRDAGWQQQVSMWCTRLQLPGQSTSLHAGHTG